MYFHSVLFITASCSVWIMPCFGSKGFKSSKHVVGDKLSLQIQFLLSIKQIALVFHTRGERQLQWGAKACPCPGHGALDRRIAAVSVPCGIEAENSGIGKVVTSVVTGAKWVAGGWLSWRLAWDMVEVHVCSGSFCCPRAKAGLNLAVLQPRRNTRLGPEHWWKSHPAQQASAAQQCPCPASSAWKLASCPP